MLSSTIQTQSTERQLYALIVRTEYLDKDRDMLHGAFQGADSAVLSLFSFSYIYMCVDHKDSSF